MRSRPTPVTMLDVGEVYILNAMSRAALFRELAEKCARKAREADRRIAPRAAYRSPGLVSDGRARRDQRTATQQKIDASEEGRRCESHTESVAQSSIYGAGFSSTF